MWKKIVGVFVCILFLVMISIPIVKADTKIFPKEDGPYSVILTGRNIIGFVVRGDIDNHPSPFWNLTYPTALDYGCLRFTIFIVNGKLQNMINMFPFYSIELRGFKGFAPTERMMSLSELIGRLWIIGTCDEIIVTELTW
jgi:hypothetical protein